MIRKKKVKLINGLKQVMSAYPYWDMLINCHNNEFFLKQIYCSPQCVISPETYNSTFT